MRESDHAMDAGLGGEILTDRCTMCDEEVSVLADEPREGPFICDRCERRAQRQQLPHDPIVHAEVASFEAICDLRHALSRCETVVDVLHLKARISALWLAWDALDQETLRKADALLAATDAPDTYDRR